MSKPTQNNFTLLKLNQIEIPFYVRKFINEDHVYHLAELYEAGVDLPPIQVTSDKHYLVDGRHRKAAMELAMQTEATVELVPPMTPAELIVAAFAANTGGSLPPTRDDIEHTIELLLERNISNKEITERMRALPPSITKKYISKVRSNIAKRSLRRAVLAVTDAGMTVEQASLRYEVNEETVRDEIRGTKKKSKSFGMDEIKGGLSAKFKSLSQTNAQLVRKLMDKVRDGEMQPEQLRETVKAIGYYINRMEATNREWEKRVASLIKGETD